jgi:hypothetical protein
MKTNLTKSQQQIIDSLTSEFGKINNCATRFKTDSLVEYINEEVDKRKRHIEIVKARNPIYNEINKKQVDVIIKTLNKLLKKFGFDCAYVTDKYSPRWASDFDTCFVVNIFWFGFDAEPKSIYFHPNFRDNNHDGLHYLIDTTLRISLTRGEEKFVQKISSLDDLLKYVADCIIKLKKSRL